ncbi:MAG TPA: C-GCAxxG-C-C family protein [Candidatus Fimivivens faecavium]|nr:C-GCAxxG-C-C family protein [Candidatus Fimivivens faecavium]
MSKREEALRRFQGGELNCAEAVLLASADITGRDPSGETMHALGAFGGGIGCGELCGAIAAAAAAVGLSYIDTHAHACPRSKQAAAALTGKCIRELGSLRCEELKPRYFDEKLRCTLLVEKALDLLEETAAEIG